MAKYCIILMICFFAALTYYRGPAIDSASIGSTSLGALCLAAAYLILLRFADPFPMLYRGVALNWASPQAPLLGAIVLGSGLFSLQPPPPFESTVFLILAAMLAGAAALTTVMSWYARKAIPYGVVVLGASALVLGVVLVEIGARVSLLVSLLTLVEFGCLSLVFRSIAASADRLPGPVVGAARLWAAATTIVICVYALANNAVLICVVVLGILVFVDLPTLTTRRDESDHLLSKIYWTMGILFWLAVVAYTVAEPLDGRVLYAIVVTSLIVPFGHWLMFGRSSTGDIVLLVKPVLYFNLVVIILHYISSHEFVHLRDDFHVGYHFGNFSDFMAIVNSQVAGSYEWILTGYNPFVFAFAKIIGISSHWQAGPFAFTEHLQLYYLIFLIAGLAPLGLLLYGVVKRRGLDRDQTFFGAFFLVTCYPVLFEIERGNFVLLSASFLALTVWSFQRSYLRSAAVFVGLLVSLKILNVIYIPFVLYNLWGKVRWFFATVFFATLTSLFYLVGTDFKKWQMFARVILVPLGGLFGIAAPQMTDSGKLAGGTTGLDAYRVLLRSLFLRVKDNITTDMAWFNLGLMVGGVLLIVYFYRWVRKSSDWNDELMLLTLVPLLAHPASGSYNLLLLLPMLLELTARSSSSHRDRLLRFALPIFLLSAGLVITSITCCGPGYYTPVTPESFLIPFALATLCLQLCVRDHSDDRTA